MTKTMICNTCLSESESTWQHDCWLNNLRKGRDNNMPGFPVFLFQENWKKLQSLQIWAPLLFLEMEQERILAAMVFEEQENTASSTQVGFFEIQIRKPTISKGMSTNLVSFLFWSTWICMPEGKAPTDSLNSYLNVHRSCEWSMKMQFNFMWLKLIM